MNEQQMAFACGVACAAVIIIMEMDDDLNGESRPKGGKRKQEYIPVGPTKPISVYDEYKGTNYFKRMLGVSERVFDYIHNGLKQRILEPRNVRYKYTDAQNQARRHRQCKATTQNRVAAFLYSMKNGSRVWATADRFGSNVTTISDDFRHVASHFVKQFDAEWIREMNEDEKKEAANLFEVDGALYALDGKQFLRRRSTKLPDGVRRKDMYCHKHKMPEGDNTQAKVNGAGIACEVLTGVPGGMNDITASRYMCHNDAPRSVLVDGGYPDREQFILPDGDEHRRDRVIVENYFAALSNTWSMVGETYRRKNSMHATVIRGSFILTNMNVVDSGGLRKY